MKSLNQIIAELETFANVHYQIHTFGHGDVWEATPNSSEIVYPLLWLVPNGATTGVNEVTTNFTVLCMDLVRSGEENETEVLSDTLQIILDVISYYRQQHDQTYIVEFGSQIQPFTEAHPDMLAGHSITVSIRQPFTYNECAIPFSGAPAPIVPTCAAATIQNAASNPTYQASIASGDNLVLPQVKVLDSDGVTEILANYLPNTDGYVAECSLPTCADATVELNGIEVGTIASGGTESFPVLQDGSPVGSWNGSEWIVPPCSGGYVRPSDWIELPEIVAGDNKFAAAVAVWDNDTNFVTIEVHVDSGTWSVDWGDGNTQTGISSGSIVEHSLSYAGAGGTLTTRGYKTSLVVVTTSGGNLTKVRLQNAHSSSTTRYVAPWLDIRLAGANIDELEINDGTSSVDFNLLEQLDFVGTNSITANGNRFLYFLFGLRKVVNLDTSGFTNFNQFIINTDVLQELPTIDLSSETTIQNSFISQGLPKISLSNIGSITNMQQAFGLSNYIEIEADGSATTALTNMNIAFIGNPLLQVLPDLGDTSGVTIWQWAFRDCESLRVIPAYDLSGATNMSLWVNGSPSISRILAYGCTVTHSIADCNMGVAALEEYATNLGDGTGQTLTTSGNPGSGSWDTTIATDKNWTVVD